MFVRPALSQVRLNPIGRLRPRLTGRQVILSNGFKLPKEIPACIGNLPTLVVPQYIAIAENVQDGHAPCQPSDPLVPFGSAAAEDRNVTIERGNCRPATFVTGQYLQDRNLNTQIRVPAVFLFSA